MVVTSLSGGNETNIVNLQFLVDGGYLPRKYQKDPDRESDDVDNWIYY